MEGGFSILTTPELVGSHYHRQGLRKLSKEYFSSGRGCAQFVRCYPAKSFARRRRFQLTASAVLALLTTMLLVAVPLVTLVTGLLIAVAMSCVTAWRVRDVRAVWYPYLTAFLGSCFCAGFWRERLFAKPIPASWTPELQELIDGPVDIDLTIPEPREADFAPKNRAIVDMVQAPGSHTVAASKAEGTEAPQRAVS